MKRQSFRKLLQKEMVQFCPKDRMAGVAPKDYANAGATLVLYLLGKPEPPFQSFDALKVSDPYQISGDPAQWKDVQNLSGSPLWQNTKDPTYFSKSSGENWYNVDAEHAKQALRNVATSLKRYDPIVGENVDDEDEKEEKPDENPEAPEEPAEEQPEEPAEEPEAEEPPAEEQPEEPAEEPEAEEPPAEEPTGEEPAEEKTSLTKEDAKLVVKLLLQFKGKKIPKQATTRIAKSLGVTADVVEGFVYNLATLYVKKHLIGREPKVENFPSPPTSQQSLAPSGPRPLSVIAREIYKDWKNVNFAARPYLAAMGSLDTMKDMYGADNAQSVVAYFLSNASTWKGETAKRVKAELNKMLKSAR